MQGFAEFNIQGRVGKITEVGTAVKISLASKYRKQDDRGDWHDDPHWNTVTAFGKRADWIKEKCQAGDLIHAKGRIREGSYEKDGETQYTVELVCDEFRRLAKKFEAKEEGGQE